MAGPCGVGTLPPRSGTRRRCPRSTRSSGGALPSSCAGGPARLAAWRSRGAPPLAPRCSPPTQPAGAAPVRGRDRQACFRGGVTREGLAEPLAAVAALPAQGFLQEAWTYILQNAAHDTACGSGIDAVAVEARGRSDAAQQLAEAV